MRERPSVGWIPFVGSKISTEWPNGLDERVNSSDFGDGVASTVGSWVVSSLGIMWSMGWLGRGAVEYVVISLVVEI